VVTLDAILRIHVLWNIMFDAVARVAFPRNKVDLRETCEK
jgi:hypothetical protein